LHEAALDDQVVVGAHQAEGMDPPAEALRRDAEEVQEAPAIVVVAEDQHVVDPKGRDVVDPVSKHEAR
jgi:hypothetical protein